ncbi:MAG: DNA repair protein RecO [Clostridiales bacterium]|nr:DNA repair protein RecO [Clostridiales bacterium]
MEEKLSGIVLGGVNYGENDKIINVFTLEKGVVSAKIKGVKKAGAKLKFASEPFCFAEFVFFLREGKRTVKTASLIDSFYSVREDIIRFFAGGAVLEFVRKTLKEEIPAPEMFSLALSTLKDIAYGGKNPKEVLVKFFLSAFFETGYALNLNGCSSCLNENPARVFFDYTSGAFFCEECREEGAREIKSTTYYTLKDLLNDKEIEDFRLLDPLKLIDYYATNKIEVNIKSLKELIKLCV